MKQLRILRKERKMSMKELGKQLGVTESAVSLYELGKREPSNDVLVKMCNFFDVPESFFLARGVFQNWEQLLDYKKNIMNQIGHELSNNPKNNDTSFFNFLIGKARESISGYVHMLLMFFERIEINAEAGEMQLFFIVEFAMDTWEIAEGVKEIILTSKEEELIIAYRKQKDMQCAVDKILGIDGAVY